MYASLMVNLKKLEIIKGSYVDFHDISKNLVWYPLSLRVTAIVYFVEDKYVTVNNKIILTYKIGNGGDISILHGKNDFLLKYLKI